MRDDTADAELVSRHARTFAPGPTLRMTDTPAILLVDTNASDRELAALLLQRAFPEASITCAEDAMDFAEAVTGEALDIAIIAPDVDWTRAEKLVGVLKRRSPETAIVLFGRDEDVLSHLPQPGLAFDGLLRKGSAGFMALTEVVSDVLARSRRPAPPRASGIRLADLPVAAFTADAWGRLDAANSQFEDELDVDAAVLVGGELDPWLADDAARAAWRDFLSRPADTETHLPLRARDGRSANVVVRRGASIVAAFVGVVEARAASGSLVQHPAGQERSQQEMRDIALVFSHDLKEPIHQIVRLVRRAQAGEDEPRRPGASLQQMLDCAGRASNMLDGMLEYLAVAARENASTLVDLNVCLERALDNLRGLIEESNAEIIADHLPSAVGDEYQVLHLFQNLISNAIKFRGRERPSLRITVEASGNDWQLAFRDNGIGIPEPFSERIFEMGQRLHTRDEYPGTGIGLALCKRIVERHGGRIWVESADGAGATFYILLPRAPSHVTRLA